MPRSSKIVWSFLEIAILLLPPLAIMWVTPLVIPGRPERNLLDLPLMIVTLVIAMALNAVHLEGPREVGIRFGNFMQAARALVPFTLMSSFIVIGVAVVFHRNPFGAYLGATQVAVRPLWAFLQQYGVQGVINRRWQAALGKGRRSVLLTAATFSALHAPNPVLVLATLIAGYFWAKMFQSVPNLFAIALSHALLSTLLSNSCPAAILPNMKVGWGFWSTAR